MFLLSINHFHFKKKKKSVANDYCSWYATILQSAYVFGYHQNHHKRNNEKASSNSECDTICWGNHQNHAPKWWSKICIHNMHKNWLERLADSARPVFHWFP